MYSLALQDPRFPVSMMGPNGTWTPSGKVITPAGSGAWEPIAFVEWVP